MRDAATRTQPSVRHRLVIFLARGKSHAGLLAPPEVQSQGSPPSSSGLRERLGRSFQSCCQGSTKETHFAGEYSGMCVKTKITQPHQPVLREAQHVLGAGNRQRPCSRWGAEGQKQDARWREG